MAVSDMIKGSLVAAVISDPRLPDNPIIACNSAFETLTGYTHDEVIGRNCRFLTGPDSEPELIEALREGIREHRPVMVEILNYKKNGAPFRNAVMVAPCSMAKESSNISSAPRWRSMRIPAARRPALRAKRSNA
jgi:PAS domain S-box-containing protein